MEWELWPLQAYCSAPDVGTTIWWYQLGLTPDLSTWALWQPPELSGSPESRDISGVSRRMDKGNENLVYPFPWNFKRALTCRKILQHGTSCFTSHSKKGVVRIFIALKNLLPWPGSNQRPLGPVASTLTTTSRRQLPFYTSGWKNVIYTVFPIMIYLHYTYILPSSIME
jgi:hypothetical protein